ncbi:hypothetical protein D3C72_1793800 [compost metagenome]
MVGRCRVEHPAVGQAALGQVLVGPAQHIVRLAHVRGEDPHASGHVRDMGADAGHDVRMVARVGQVDGPHVLGAGMQEVGMRIEDAGHHACAFHIDAPGRRAGERTHVIERAGRHHGIAFQDQRFVCLPTLVLGEDRSTEDQRSISWGWHFISP